MSSSRWSSCPGAGHLTLGSSCHPTLRQFLYLCLCNLHIRLLLHSENFLTVSRGLSLVVLCFFKLLHFDFFFFAFVTSIVCGSNIPRNSRLASGKKPPNCQWVQGTADPVQRDGPTNPNYWELLHQPISITAQSHQINPITGPTHQPSGITASSQQTLPTTKPFHQPCPIDAL